MILLHQVFIRKSVEFTSGEYRTVYLFFTKNKLLLKCIIFTGTIDNW